MSSLPDVIETCISKLEQEKNPCIGPPPPTSDPHSGKGVAVAATRPPSLVPPGTLLGRTEVPARAGFGKGGRGAEITGSTFCAYFICP